MPRFLGRYQLLEKLPCSDDLEATFLATRGEEQETVELRVVRACAHAASCLDDCATEARPGGHTPRRVVHPNLERAREYEVDRGLLVTVSDHRKAGPLPEYLAARSHLEADVVLDLLLPVGEALAEVHEAGFIHGRVVAGRVQVEEGSERAYLPHLPACSAFGLYEDPGCRPAEHSGCAAAPTASWPPHASDDIAGYLAIVRDSVKGPERSVVVDALADVDPTQTTMPEVVERLGLLRGLIQEHRDRRCGKVSLMNMRLRQRKQATRAVRAPAELEDPAAPGVPFWGRVNRAFERLSFPGKAGLFVLLAAGSFPVPAVDQVLAHPAPPTPVATRKRTEPRVAAKPTPPAKPETPALSPEAAELLQVAEGSWRTPTDERTFAARLKAVWSYFRVQPAPLRSKLGGKEALLEIRRQAAREGGEGYAALDRLIARCREQVSADQRRAQEPARPTPGRP